MSAELEPTAGDAIEPSAVYGPDDWRPYTGQSIDMRQVMRDILDGITDCREERDKAHRYHGARWMENAEAGERAIFRYDPAYPPGQ